MAKDEMDYDEPKKKKQGFWTANRIIIAVVLIAGLLVGGYVEHMYIEPLLSADCNKCKNDIQILNDEIKDCLLEKTVCEKSNPVK